MVKYAFLIFVMLIFACYEQNIEFEGTDAEIRLSVYAVLKPNSTPKFEIHYAIKASSVSTASNEYEVQTGGGVLFENDQFLDSIVYDPSETCFLLKERSLIKYGAKYFFDFYGPDGLRVLSEKISIPAALPAIEATLDTLDCISLTNDFIGCKLKIQISDTTNHHLLWRYLPFPELERVGFPEVGQENGGTTACSQKSFGDHMIISKECPKLGVISYYVPYRLEANQSYMKDRYDHYRISIGTISDSYYYYIDNLSDQFDYDLAISIDPVITYSNMLEGLGVLVAVNDTIIDINPR